MKLDHEFGLPGLTAKINSLDNLLLDALTSEINPSLRTNVVKVLSPRSKRVRPALVFATAALDPMPETDSMPGSVAIELVHLASLVHDDIMDESAVRWESPSPAASTDGLAIISGDYILSKAFKFASFDPKVARIIADTVATLCDGQSLEISQRHDASRTISSYLEVCTKKTAALFVAAIKTGSVYSTLDENKIDRLAEYALNFGLGYQILNDLGDLSHAHAGLSTSNDLSQGNYTLPVLSALASNDSKVFIKLLKSKKQGDLLAALFSGPYIDDAFAQVGSYFSTAAAALQGLGPNRVVTGLSHLPASYLKAYLTEAAPKPNSAYVK